MVLNMQGRNENIIPLKHNKHMYDQEAGEEMELFCCEGKFKKEFKLAHLKKKEGILEAKLGFVREIKELVKKSHTETKA